MPNYVRRRRHRNRFSYFRLRSIKHDHLTWKPTTGLSTGIAFSLGDVPYPQNYWDYYRISKVVIQIRPEFGAIPLNADKDKILYGSTVVDYDDATLAT